MKPSFKITLNADTFEVDYHKIPFTQLFVSPGKPVTGICDFKAQVDSSLLQSMPNGPYDFSLVGTNDTTNLILERWQVNFDENSIRCIHGIKQKNQVRRSSPALIYPKFQLDGF